MISYVCMIEKKTTTVLFICIYILVKSNVFAVSLNFSIGSSDFQMQEVKISIYARRPVN